MQSTLDLLWLRIPPIRYVSPPACAFEASGSGSSGPTIIVEVHPRLRVTGLRIENCMLLWDALAGDCEGACPAVQCYNVYRAEEGSETYELVAECLNATEFAISDNACYRVSAITLEGETDLSDVVCSECACADGEPQTPEELVWEPSSFGGIFEMTSGNEGSFTILTLPGQTKQFETQASICNRSRSPVCLRLALNYDLNASTVVPPNNMAQFDIWSDTIPLGTFQLLSVGPASVIGGVFEATLPLAFGSNTIYMRARGASVPTGLVNFEGTISFELTDCTPPPTLVISDCVLSWTALPGASSYNIYRNNVPFSLGYIDTVLAVFDDACYRVSANVPGGETAFSNQVCSECVVPSCDDEVLDWVTRVVGFGSSVSQTTFDAACELMAGLKATGLRSKIKRMGIYAGDTKEACNAPFIRDLGASFEQFRNVIGFGTWLYSETGAGGGLHSLGNDILDTEIPANDPNLPLEDYHIGFYKTTSDGFGDRVQMGAGTSTGSPVVLAAVFTPVTSTNWFMHNPTGDILGVPDTNQLGHFVLARNGTLTAYKNGASIGSNAAPAGSRSAGNIYVHNGSLDGNPWPAAAANGTFACYHIGTFLTAGEVATLYGLIQDFQTALTREV